MEDTPEDRISWHPAFLPALQLTFEDYLDALDFEAEHPLNREPLRIDALVIKKKPEVVIDNPVARIFRQYNILEYKSPSGTLAAKDFDKLLLYGLGYEAAEKRDLCDISVSLVTAKEPGAVLAYIREVWGYRVWERESGIYEAGGSPFAVQIVYTRRLSGRENPFLADLDGGLDVRRLTEVFELADKPHRIDISAYVDVIARANKALLKETEMLNSPVLKSLLEEAGWSVRWEKLGEERGEKRGREWGEKQGREWGEKQGKEQERREIALKLIKEGWTIEKISRTTKLDAAVVESLSRKLETPVIPE